MAHTSSRIHRVQESHEAEVARLAAGLAHEIKNPLSTMNLTLQLLREQWRDAQDEKQRTTLRKLDALQAEVRRLERILDEFLMFARQPKLDRKPHDLNQLVNECLDLLQPEFEASNVSVRSFLAEGLPSVPIDRDQLKQALLNILINARQSMAPATEAEAQAAVPLDANGNDRNDDDDEGNSNQRPARTTDRTRGGELFVTTRLAPGIGSEDSSLPGPAPSSEEPVPVDTHAVEVEITDTGPGIPADIIDHVLDPYFSTKPTGTGMGLTIARRVIDEHDGEMTLISEPGQGTQFRIRLPRDV